MIWAFGVGVPAAWVTHALVLSRVMSARGFHPLSWMVAALFLGPMVWPFALAEASSGAPYPEVVRRGGRRPGLHVFVLLERDELPDALARQVRRLLPDCGRVVVGRVLAIGGPASIKSAAQHFLDGIAQSLDTPIVELQLLYGTADAAADRVYEEGAFAFVLRSDDPRELYDGGGQVQKVRCLRGSPAA